MSYFDSVVQSSMRKDVLGETPSGHGDTIFKTNITAVSTFKHFDANADGQLDKGEFDKLLDDLFRDASGNPHTIDAAKLDEMFAIFNKGDLNKGDGISMQDFQDCWNCWIKTILRPVSAIVVVDVQNDFVHPEGFYGKQTGDLWETYPLIPRMLHNLPELNVRHPP